MNPQKRIMLWINIVGGVLVIGSYIVGLGNYPGGIDAFWGAMPSNLRTVSTTNMPLAAVGYLLFSYFIFFHFRNENTQVAKSKGLRIFNFIYLGILIPSAMWMPLTYAVVVNYSLVIWLLVVLDLSLVGLASIAVLVALLLLQPKRPRWAYWLAILGTAPFILQTVVMDAVLWVFYFLQ